MSFRSADEITAAALAEAARTEDPRARQLLLAAVTHLHAFVRETGLTEAEFFRLCAAVLRAGQLSTASHNEVVLTAGALGLSALVCLQNNAPASTANLLGPFWRAGTPLLPSGASLLQSPTPGAPVWVRIQVVDTEGLAVAAARVDVWHASPEGFYENQDPEQADMNLRGCFQTDAEGRFDFHTVKPVGYPIPAGGTAGDVVRLQGRHNLRPAHIHFLVAKPGIKTQFAQVYSSDDPNLDTDVAYAVTPQLVGHYQMLADGSYVLEHRLVVQAGDSRLPVPPITGKAAGGRPSLDVLDRR